MKERFEAVLFDAGGVLVLPDPTVLIPLLAPYGADGRISAHRRAHYAGMARKSSEGSDERDWDAYNREYVERVGVVDGVDNAVEVLDRTRSAHLWRWPIPETVDALRSLAAANVPMGVVSNAAGQIEAVLRRTKVCQVGVGDGVDMRCVIDSHEVGVAKPDPRIFDFALTHFDGVERDRIAYVGDSVSMDIASSRAAGLHPILLDPFDDHSGASFERIRTVGDFLIDF